MKNKTLEFEIHLDPNFNFLNTYRNLVFEKAKQFGFDEIQAFHISIAFEEAITNIFKHSLKDTQTKILKINITFEDNSFSITISDDGKSFDPNTFPNTEIIDLLKNKQKGGMGILLMKKIFDKIEYTPKSNQCPQNKLVLKKSLI